MPARLLLCLILTTTLATAQTPKRKPIGEVKLVTQDIDSREVVYKTTPQGELQLHFYLPPGFNPETDKRPAILFFFGGGWKSGSFKQFVPQAQYFASRGLVCASADYRISSVHQTTPDRCVADAKSAMRWLRAHAAEWGIDPDKIIASGGSAGGHLAAATALLPGFDEAGEDTTVSCKPCAMVLFNPALDLTLLEDRTIPDADGNDITAAFSPNLFLTKDTPPAILFFGTADALGSHGAGYLNKARELGASAELWTAADQPHGFFNHEPWTQATTAQADRFLTQLGYLTGEPTFTPEAILENE